MGKPSRKVVERRKPRELKNLSSGRKRNQNRDSLSSASEKGTAQTYRGNSIGVVGRTIKWTRVDRRTQLGSWSIEGETPVAEIDRGRECVPEYHGTLGILWESARTIS